MRGTPEVEEGEANTARIHELSKRNPRFDCGGWVERVATPAVVNNEIGFKTGSTRNIRGSSHMTFQPCTYRMGKMLHGLSSRRAMCMHAV